MSILAGSNKWSPTYDGSTRHFCVGAFYDIQVIDDRTANIVISKVGLYKISPGKTQIVKGKKATIRIYKNDLSTNLPTSEYTQYQRENSDSFTWSNDTPWKWWLIKDGLSLKVPVKRPVIEKNESTGAIVLPTVPLKIYGSLFGTGTAWEGSSSSQVTHSITNSNITKTFYNSVEVPPSIDYVIRYYDPLDGDDMIQNVIYQKEATFLSNITLEHIPSRDGYEFLGWSLVPPNDPNYDPSAVYPPGSEQDFSEITTIPEQTGIPPYTSLEYNAVNLYAIWYKRPTFNNVVAYRVAAAAGESPIIENTSKYGFVSFYHSQGYGYTLTEGHDFDSQEYTEGEDGIIITFTKTVGGQQIEDRVHATICDPDDPTNQIYAYTSEDNFCPADASVDVNLEVRVTDYVGNQRVYSTSTYISSSEVGIDLFIQNTSRKINMGIGCYADETDDNTAKLDIAKEIRLVIDDNSAEDSQLCTAISSLGWGDIVLVEED